MHKKPLVLITGGTSGLGKCLATIFIHQNKDLALIARKKDELTRVKEEFENINPNINLYIFDGNIADEEFVKYIYAFIEKKGYFKFYRRAERAAAGGNGAAGQDQRQPTAAAQNLQG